MAWYAQPFEMGEFVIEVVRRSAASFAADRFFYGWAMVAIAGLGVFVSGAGQSHTFSVFIEPISRDLQVSSASIATAYGAATLVAAFLLPQTGRLVDRFGVRKAMLVVTVLLGVGCILFGAAANVMWLALGFAMLRFFGQGSLMLGSANLVSQWFARSRGYAMGLMALGFGVSMAVHPPLSQWLIETIGWRQAWFILGALTWLMFLPPLLLLVYNTPEELKLHPDGDRTAVEADHNVQTATEIQGLTLREALSTVSFYIVSAGWFTISMLVTTLHFWQVTVMTRQGVAADVAAQVFTISAIAMACAMPLVGRAFDRFRTRYVFASGLIITGFSLIAVTMTDDAISAAYYALLFGLNNAFSMTMFGYLWPRYFGRKHLGSIQGTGQMTGVVGASLGPLPVGWAFDAFGEAGLTLQLLALMPFAAALIVIAFLRAPAALQESQHLE
ncbi:MAG: MFS transporter [Hyphomicrobiaceae bacterium]